MGSAIAHSNYTDAAELDPRQDATLAQRIRQFNNHRFYAQLTCTIACLLVCVALIIALGFAPSLGLFIIALICVLCFLGSLANFVRLLRQRRYDRRARQLHRQARGGGAGNGDSDIEVDGFMYNAENGTFIPVLAVPEGDVNPADRTGTGDGRNAAAADTFPGMALVHEPRPDGPTTVAAQGSPLQKEDGDKVYGRATYLSQPANAAQVASTTSFDKAPFYEASPKGTQANTAPSHEQPEASKPPQQQQLFPASDGANGDHDPRFDGNEVGMSKPSRGRNVPNEVASPFDPTHTKRTTPPEAALETASPHTPQPMEPGRAAPPADDLDLWLGAAQGHPAAEAESTTRGGRQGS